MSLGESSSVESFSAEGGSVGKLNVSLSCGCAVGSDGPRTDGSGSMVINVDVVISGSLPAAVVGSLVGRPNDKALQQWSHMDTVLYKGTLGKTSRLRWGIGSVVVLPSTILP